MELFGVDGYLQQIYWINGNSVDDPYQRCLRLYLYVTHTQGCIDQYPCVRLDVLYIFRLQDLLQLYYILLKQLKPARLYIFFLEWIVVH